MKQKKDDYKDRPDEKRYGVQTGFAMNRTRGLEPFEKLALHTVLLHLGNTVWDS